MHSEMPSQCLIQIIMKILLLITENDVNISYYTLVELLWQSVDYNVLAPFQFRFLLMVI